MHFGPDRTPDAAILVGPPCCFQHESMSTCTYQEAKLEPLTLARHVQNREVAAAACLSEQLVPLLQRLEREGKVGTGAPWLHIVKHGMSIFFLQHGMCGNEDSSHEVGLCVQHCVQVVVLA